MNTTRDIILKTRPSEYPAFLPNGCVHVYRNIREVTIQDGETSEIMYKADDFTYDAIEWQKQQQYIIDGQNVKMLEQEQENAKLKDRLALAEEVLNSMIMVGVMSL